MCVLLAAELFKLINAMTYTGTVDVKPVERIRGDAVDDTLVSCRAIVVACGHHGEDIKLIVRTASLV